MRNWRIKESKKHALVLGMSLKQEDRGSGGTGHMQAGNHGISPFSREQGVASPDEVML